MEMDNEDWEESYNTIGVTREHLERAIAKMDIRADSDQLEHFSIESEIIELLWATRQPGDLVEWEEDEDEEDWDEEDEEQEDEEQEDEGQEDEESPKDDQTIALPAAEPPTRYTISSIIELIGGPWYSAMNIFFGSLSAPMAVPDITGTMYYSQGVLSYTYRWRDEIFVSMAKESVLKVPADLMIKYVNVEITSNYGAIVSVFLEDGCEYDDIDELEQKLAKDLNYTWDEFYDSIADENLIFDEDDFDINLNENIIPVVGEPDEDGNKEIRVGYDVGHHGMAWYEVNETVDCCSLGNLDYDSLEKV